MVQNIKDFEISYSQEILRKGIHLISLSIPITYSFVTKEFALSLLIPITILSIIFDFASRENNKFRYYYHKIFGKMLRPHEYYDVFTLNGASWVFITAVLCILVFPKLIMVTGFSILIVSDVSSALIGRRYGKHKLFIRKSWEGTAAFWVSAFMVIIVIGLLLNAPWTFFLFGFIAAFVGGFAEAIAPIIKMDDNITIPVSIGLVMWVGEWISVTYLSMPFMDYL
jgi:dolichol kinase